MKRIVMKDVRNNDYYYDEAIKVLRSNIQFAGKNVKSILLTSCFQNEGKSDIALSLAREMGAAGKKVLLLDADIRKSVYVSRFHVQESITGLSEFLSGQRDSNDLIYSTNFQNMDIIFAGKSAPNPSALLGDETFEKLLEKLREYYDYVFIDTPPIENVIDAAVVAEKCDGAILVVEAGFASHNIAKKAVNQIQMTGCRIIGGVLNKVDIKKDKYYYGRYSKYYGRNDGK